MAHSENFAVLVEVKRSNSLDQSHIKVKQEDVKECFLCLDRNEEVIDVQEEQTVCSHTDMLQYISKVTTVQLETLDPTHACKSCLYLLNQMDKLEFELEKIKTSFNIIISKNPLFNTLNVLIKSEVCDSDDEPLAVTTKKKKSSKTKAKKSGHHKKVQNNIDTKCNECGLQFYSMEELSVHKVLSHTHNENETFKDLNEIKEEENSTKSSRKHSIDIDSPGEDDRTDTVDYDEVDMKTESQVEFLDSKSVKKRRGRKPKGEKDVTDIKAEYIKDLPNTEVKLVKRNNRMKSMYSCKLCNGLYTNLRRFQCHMQSHEIVKPPFICEVCGVSYKHKRACDIHVAMHKGISPWRCDECNKIFPSKHALRRHNYIHEGKAIYQCDLCGKSFIHLSSFKMHKLSHSGLKPHKCDLCGLALMTKSHLKRHKRIHSGEKRHECSICGKRFSERYNLFAHQKSHHELSNENQSTIASTNNIDTNSIKSKPKFRCRLCDQKFERRFMLEKHMQIVHQRILERDPPKPRNTMTKLLKAKAEEESKKNLGSIESSNQNKDNSTLNAVPLLIKVKPDLDESSPSRTHVTNTNNFNSSSRPTTQPWSEQPYVEFPRMPDFSH